MDLVSTSALSTAGTLHLSVVKCPICIVTLGTALAIFVTGLGVATLPLEIDTSFETFLKTDVESSVMLDAWRQAVESRQKERRLTNAENYLQFDDLTLSPPNAGGKIGRFGVHSGDRRLAGHVVKELYVAYEASGELSSSKGMFDEDTLSAISDFEEQIRAAPKYQELCSRVDQAYQRHCNPGISFVNIAAPSAEIANGSIVPKSLILDGRGTDLIPLQASLHLAKMHQLEEIFFPRNVVDDLGSPESVTTTTLLRSTFRFKLPVEEGGGTAIEAEWESFVRELMPLLREGCKVELKGCKFKVFFAGTGLLGIQVKEALDSDIRLAAFGAAFVLFYLCFHTRSLLLAVMGLLLTMLSVPLSFICSAMLAGTTTVSFASFLSLFLVVGFGSDVIFVYTDFWRDSAMHHKSVEDRLAWTFKYAIRASLATSGTTALSFFANLASVIRALREFGFFMGLCVMTVWLLITILYAPLLLIDEVYFGKFHFRACWMRSALARDDAGADAEKECGLSPSTHASYLNRWSEHIHQWRRSWCFLPILAAIGCAGLASSSARLMQGLPNIFSDGHNVVAGEPVMFQFTDLPSEIGAMPETEKVCNEQRFGNQDSQACALFWCESSLSSSSDPIGESCQCSRRDKPLSSCSSASSTQFDVIQRFVHPVEITSNRIEKAVEEHWKTGGSNDADDLVLPSSSSRSDSVKVAMSLPILQHEWDTGEVVISRITEVKTLLQKGNNSANEACGWEELCHCGNLVCQMREGMWSEMPRLHLSTGSSTMVNSPRRIGSDNSDTKAASAPGDRRLGRPLFLQRRPPVSIDVSPRRRLTDMTLVQIGFGLKVQRTMPLLGMNSDVWDFQDGFSLRSPWSQRNLFNFCRDFPDQLLVKRKRCWMEDFREWLRSRNQRWPVLVDEFEMHASAYIASGNAKTSGTNYIWLHEKEIKALMVAVEVGVPDTVAPEIGLEYKKHWDNYVDKFNENAEEEVTGAFHVSGLWVICEMQSALFVGTAWTLVILLGLAFVGMLVFTRSLILSFYVVLSTILVIMLLAFYIVKVEGWELGLIEIIAMIYFIGYAVTYSLHVAHKYAGSNALQDETAPIEDEPPTIPGWKVRLQRTSFSLKTIGGAALGSAATTAGTSFFLVFCELKIFTKLGAMCLAVTVMSIVTALGPLPAMLMIAGPINPGHCRKRNQSKSIRTEPSDTPSADRQLDTAELCIHGFGAGGSLENVSKPGSRRAPLFSASDASASTGVCLLGRTAGASECKSSASIGKAVANHNCSTYESASGLRMAANYKNSSDDKGSAGLVVESDEPNAYPEEINVNQGSTEVSLDKSNAYYLFVADRKPQLPSGMQPAEMVRQLADEWSRLDPGVRFKYICLYEEMYTEYQRRLARFR